MSSLSMLDAVGMHTFGNFLDLLLLISNLIPLGPEGTLCLTSILLHLVYLLHGSEYGLSGEQTMCTWEDAHFSVIGLSIQYQLCQGDG